MVLGLRLLLRPSTSLRNGHLTALGFSRGLGTVALVRSTGAVALPAFRGARAAGTQTAKKAQAAKRLQQERSLLGPQRPKPTASTPAAGSEPPATSVTSNISRSTMQYAGVAVTVIVVGGIAYAWSTLIDLLRKLDRVRQTAVEARGENGGVPPLEPVSVTAVSKPADTPTPPPEPPAAALAAESNPAPAAPAGEPAADKAVARERASEPAGDGALQRSGRLVLETARTCLASLVGTVHGTGALAHAAWRALAELATDAQVVSMLRLGATTLVGAAVGVLSYGLLASVI
jgi:hypothetical protein